MKNVKKRVVMRAKRQREKMGVMVVMMMLR